VIVGAVAERDRRKDEVDSAALGPSAGFIRVVWQEAARFKATNANVTFENSEGSFDRQSERIALG